jgi:hypothetical protein
MKKSTFSAAVAAVAAGALLAPAAAGAATKDMYAARPPRGC